MQLGGAALQNRLYLFYNSTLYGILVPYDNNMTIIKFEILNKFWSRLKLLDHKAQVLSSTFFN